MNELLFAEENRIIMSKQEDLQRVLDRGIEGRHSRLFRRTIGQRGARLYEGGVDVLEVTFTVPGVLEILSAVRRDLGTKVLLGAGTVLDPESARAAFLAGAEYIVSPCVNLDVIRLCNRYDKLVMPGALTPTEVLTAWEAGADIIKVFPADIGGPNYLKALHGPLPQVRLLPTGGVDLETIGAISQGEGGCAPWG